MHIVTYTCEHCADTHAAAVGIHTNGMCVRCGSPMKIADLFSDRRIVSLPVPQERREAGEGRAA